MDMKHEIFIKEELSGGLAIEEAPSEGRVIKDYCRGEIEYDDTNAQAYEQKSGLKEFGEDESCDSNINIKTEIEIKEDPFGIRMEDAENHESLNQISRINEKDFIEEYLNKNSDMFERSRHEGLKTENEVTEHHYMKELSCSNYNFVFESEDELMNELESCEEKVKCSRCSSPCNCEPNLKLKILNGDTDQSIFFKAKLFKCSDCSFECNHKGNLKTHMLVHQKKKLFKCSECDSEFKRKGDLKRHILIHQKTKLFKCSECNYECNQKGGLKMHMLKHQNVKFNCSECNYECNQKRFLKQHMLLHQTIT